MSIQPDHWIRKMSLEHGMIEPFIDGQVREEIGPFLFQIVQFALFIFNSISFNLCAFNL